MLRGRRSKAKKAAAWFADYKLHQSHSLGIARDQARKQGLKVTDLEADQALQDAVLSVHHCVMHTFQGPTAKLVENHLGRAWVQLEQTVQMQVPRGLPTAP
jgi:hypothetical protein